MNKKFLIFSIVLAMLYIALFFTGLKDSFALIYEKVVSGEYWRFFTYQFVHKDIEHLIKNIFSLILISIVLIEINSNFSTFPFVYFISGMLSILPVWIIIKFIALGASAAIYGSLSFIFFDVKKLNIKRYFIFLIILFITFLEFFTTYIASKDFYVSFFQFLSHSSSFIFGIFLFLLIDKIKYLKEKRKNYILRKNE